MLVKNNNFGPEYSTWDVAYEVTREGYDPAMTSVVLGPDAGNGPDTTVRDIPTIIAMTRGVRSHEIRILARKRTSPLPTVEDIGMRLRSAYDLAEHALNHDDKDRQLILEDLMEKINQMDEEIAG